MKLWASIPRAEPAAAAKLIPAEMETARQIAATLDERAATVLPPGFTVTRCGDWIQVRMPCGWLYRQLTWRHQSIAPGVTRCPVDLDNRDEQQTRLRDALK